MKRLFGIVLSTLLLTSCLWGGFQSAGLTQPLRKNIQQNPEFSSPRTSLVAQAQAEEFVLPPLPYAYDALSAYVDEQTMMIHHDKHHAGYVKNLNDAIAKHPDLKGKSVEALLQDLDNIPEDIRVTVRNNGGGHANHTMFWETMTPDSKGQPTGKLAKAINSSFGSFDAFKEAFNTAGTKQFGSGWAWLVLTPDNKLEVTSTANQDSPLLDGNTPIMGNDVWEHAYYLKYQNKRGDYLNAWWNVVNWDQVGQRYEQALSS
ncbi:Superoxide dismutase [Mn] 2 [Acaryochloris thomasi RCC1774]|uniref:Superoxide dismutase n=1 Tax=Acaryochloris thomasi RCC1774 TaxID=1764569 RepID=A0A2W1JHI3_9CYAN|nr:superoxide dismutase [Acaryochloris thomasi]PZD72806.1 Superoxide dismutase [Mn] 2 [Acaryochloris thomasi RCC1774]